MGCRVRYYNQHTYLTVCILIAFHCAPMAGGTLSVTTRTAEEMSREEKTNEPMYDTTAHISSLLFRPGSGASVTTTFGTGAPPGITSTTLSSTSALRALPSTSPPSIGRTFIFRYNLHTLRSFCNQWQEQISRPLRGTLGQTNRTSNGFRKPHSTIRGTIMEMIWDSPEGHGNLILPLLAEAAQRM